MAKTPLVVQWLRLHAPNVGGQGSIPAQGSSSHMLQLGVCMPQLKILHAATKDPISCSKDRISRMALPRPATANNRQTNIFLEKDCATQNISGTPTTQQKPKNQTKKWPMDLKRYFSPKDRQTATEHRQR